MTADTTFRGVCRGNGHELLPARTWLTANRGLVEEFNKAKLDLEAKAEDREREERKVRLGLSSTPRKRFESVT